MHRIGDITVDHPVPQSVVIYIKQDDDVIVVYRDEIGGLVDALRGYSPEPSSHITAEGKDLRMTRMIARVNIQQLRRDAAYEEGRLSVLDSILEG